MATIKELPSGAFQIRVVSKLLPKPFYATFNTREEAVAYSDQLKLLLSQGIVPKAMLEDSREVRTTWTVGRCIAEFLRNESVAISEIKLLDTLKPQLDRMSTAHLSYEWAESWVRGMKREQNLAPSTIRHRHGALARCLDWVARRHPEILGQNPLRLLKRGFAAYSDDDAKFMLLKGSMPKADVERSRRLDPDEEERILVRLDGHADERMLFILALETAMRLRECYTLDLGQISAAKKTIHLESTKNGDNRQVPLTSVVLAELREYIQQESVAIRARGGRLFPYWNGDVSVYALDAVTADLSAKFRTIIADAKVEDFRFHDLRHEATCRLYEKTSLSDVLIARITGHRDLKMLKRYASLRGSDLAARLW
jgi:integrase